MTRQRGDDVTRATLVAIFLVLSPATNAAADQAIFANGKAIEGKLQWHDGRLWFASASRRTPLRLDEVAQVRFPPLAVDPLRLGRIYRVTLTDGQRLTGEFAQLTADALQFRPSWNGPLTIPRQSLASITVPGRYLTFVDDDFERGLAAWKVIGKPTISDRQHVSGNHSLSLRAAPLQAEHSLATPLQSGRAGINFFDPVNTSGCRWWIEAEFATKQGSHVIRVAVAGNEENYTAEGLGTEPKPFAVRRSAGWHRLEIEFAAGVLVLTIDDAVLWASRLHGPGGPLCKLRLRCELLPTPAPRRGEIFFDDLALAKSIEPLGHAPADPGQDEVWLRSGDQVLGELLRSDARTVTLKGRFGLRSWNWGEVRGIFLRRQPVRPRTTDGEHVTLWLRTGMDRQTDRLSCQVLSLDSRRVTLRDAVLGDLELPRARLRRLEWGFHGRRIDLDHFPHHLGPKGKFVGALWPAQAEGVSLQWPFQLDALPQRAVLRLQVTRLKGPEDGIAKAHKRGELRTVVLLNGTVIDYLNRQAAKTIRQPRQLTLVLPRQALRIGKNVLELRLTPEHNSAHYEDCGITDLVVDIPK